MNEAREPVQREQHLQLQRRARMLMIDRSPSLALRLEVRLAAEAAYHGGPLQAVRDAVERCRLLGDDRALAESLSLLHHCLLGPDHAAERAAVADELLAAATREGDPVMLLMARCWRTVDYLLVDDRRASAAVLQLKRQTETSGGGHVRYIVRCIEASDLIRQGRLAEAETVAAEAYELGTTVGDADALAFYGGHLVALRFAQDRCHELIELIELVAGSADLAEMDHSFVAAVATAAAGARDEVTARRALDVLTAHGLGSIPRFSTWLATMLGTVLAAEELARRDVLVEAYELLSPFAELPIRPSLAVACFGSVHWPLGRAALALGRHDAAIEHLEAAVAINDRLANRPAAAIARAALAEALTARGAPGDLAAATARYEQAAALAEANEMPKRAEVWRRTAVALGAPRLAMARQGRSWRLRLGDDVIEVPGSVGLNHLAALVERPGTEISAAELAQVTAVEASRQLLADHRALDAYRHQIAELRLAIDDANDSGDFERAAGARLELEQLLDHIKPMLGIDGRARAFSSDEEKARMAVQKAIRRAMDRIDARNRRIGAHLEATVHTGRYCSYRPIGS